MINEKKSSQKDLQTLIKPSGGHTHLHASGRKVPARYPGKTNPRPQRQQTVAISVVVLTALILALLFSILPAGRLKVSTKSSSLNRRQARPCPLCSSLLAGGDRLRSIVFPGENEKIVHILGCPKCYPENEKNKRTCPVCRNILPPSGFIIGSMWENRGKKHLHVTGCSMCKLNIRE